MPSGTDPVMTKTLLIVSGGAHAAAAASRARSLGHTVVVSDSDPQAPAFAFADSCLIADAHGAARPPPPPNATTARSARSTACCAWPTMRPGRRHGDRTACACPACRCMSPNWPATGWRSAALSSRPASPPWHAEISTPQELQRVVIARARPQPCDHAGGKSWEPWPPADDRGGRSGGGVSTHARVFTQPTGHGGTGAGRRACHPGLLDRGWRLSGSGSCRQCVQGDCGPRCFGAGHQRWAGGLRDRDASGRAA